MNEFKASARKSLLEMKKECFVPFPTYRISDLQYLKWIKKYITVEFNAFVENAFPSHNFKGWQSKQLKGYLINVSNAMVRKNDNHVYYKISYANGSGGDIASELNGHLCIFRNHLCIVSMSATADDAYLHEGIHLEEINFHDSSVSDQNDERLFLIGYVGNFLTEYATATYLEENPVPILSSIADPRKRIRKVLPFRPLEGYVKVNEDQFKAVQGLCHDVEGIQGPPGTGKSTTIYFMILSCTDPSDCTLVTCVQNKAVDSIAEKLAKSLNLCFFVLGNDDRLGGVAQQWTVPRQVLRDSNVLSVETRLAAIDRLTKRLKVRFMQTGDAFGLVKKYAPEKLISGVCEECMDIVLEKRCEECAFSIIQEHSAGEILRIAYGVKPPSRKKRTPVEIFDATRQCDHCRKLRCRPCTRAQLKNAFTRAWFSTLYGPLRMFIVTLARRRYQLDEMLNIAKQDAEKRIIETSRAVLCTVDMTGKLFKEKYKNCTKRIKEVCLDEAGILNELLLEQPTIQAVLSIAYPKLYKVSGT